MSKAQELFDDALVHVLVRAWVKATQLTDWAEGRRGNTRFRKLAPGRYKIEIEVPVGKVDIVDGEAKISATGGIWGIAEFLSAREDRLRAARKS